MWFSLANGETVPADLRSNMSAAQIVKAERMTERWKSLHPEPQIFCTVERALVDVSDDLSCLP
jgi:hypothetical protein